MRVAAGANLPTPWLFEAAKLPDERADIGLQFPYLVPNPGTRFHQLSGLGRTLRVINHEGSAH